MSPLMHCFNPLMVGLLIMRWNRMVRYNCVHPLKFSKHATANIIIGCLTYFQLKCGVFSFGELQKLFFLANISSWSHSWPKFSFYLKCLPLNNKALTMQHMKSCPHLVRGLLWVFLCQGPLRIFLCRTIPTD